MGLENSVTIGVISAKGRSHLNIGGGGQVYQNFIQTDASINVGNSGGPLVNIKGDVIGINAAMNAQGQNLGFAIPSNLAKNIIKQLREKGKVTRGYIGIYITDLTPEIAQSLGLPVKDGVLVNSVTPGGPAEKAGLMKGDVIIKADGKTVKDANTLMFQIGDVGSDNEVSLTYYRGSKQIDTKIKLIPRPEDLGKDTKSKGRQIGENKNNNEDAFGIKVIDLTHPSLSRYKFPVSQGVVVMSIDEMSSASGVLTRGDVITEVNRTPVNNVNDFKKVMDGLKGKKDPVVLYIYRENNGIYLSFTP